MSSRRKTGLSCLGLAVAVFAVFGQIVGHEFFDYDLRPFLTGNAWLQHGLTREGLVRAFTRFDAGIWQPVTWVSYMLEIELFGLRPGPMHLGNVAIHAANAALVFVVLRELTGSAARSLLVAALFALHPQRVEAVAWIVERKGLLCAFFGLLALHFWIGWTRERRRGAYIAALLCFAAGLMSKAMLVTWPFVMLLLDAWPLDRARIGLRQRIVEKLPFLALSILTCVLAYFAQRAGGAVQSLERFSVGARVANVPLAYAAYLRQTLWPSGLSIHYEHLGLTATATEVAVAVLWLGAITAAGIGLRRRAPWILVGWLWFLGTLVPVIGLVQIGGHSTADRFTYLPVLGVLVAIVWSVAELTKPRTGLRGTSTAAAAASCVALALLSWRETSHWKDTETLCRHALELDPRNQVARHILGARLVNEGRIEEALPLLLEVHRAAPEDLDATANLAIALAKLGRNEEAEPLLREVLLRAPARTDIRSELARILVASGRDEEAETVLRRAPARDLDPDLRRNVALALWGQGKRDEALAEIEAVIARTPDFAMAHMTHGQLLEELGRPDEARHAFESALEIDPRYVEARLTLARLLVRAGDLESAERELQRAVAEDPAEPEGRRGLALVLIGRGKLAEALLPARAALELRPDWALAMGDLAWILARVEDDRLRDPEQAVSLGEAAARATGRRHPGILDSLAAAYAARGDIPKAAATAEEALNLALDQRDDAFATRVGRRLMAYRAGTIDLEAPR